MDERTRDPRKITAEDINPRYNWGRHLPVLGIMGVDFEERVDYRRLHRYRLGRAQAALEASDLGALLVFDVNNIRYVTSTKIGEWERDKLSRWALLTRDRRSDPVGLRLGRRASQALCALAQAGELQGRPGRPARHRRSRLRPDEAEHAEEMASLLKEAGVAKMPVGVDIIEPPMMFELRESRPEVKRRPAGDAGARARSSRRTRSRCSTAPPPWSTAPIT